MGCSFRGSVRSAGSESLLLRNEKWKAYAFYRDAHARVAESRDEQGAMRGRLHLATAGRVAQPIHRHHCKVTSSAKTIGIDL